MCYAVPIGAIAQLGERVLCKHEVVGSIPSGSTISLGMCLRGGGNLAINPLISFDWFAARPTS